MLKHVYLLLGALFLMVSLQAQPVVTGLAPAANAHNASLTGDIAITFSQPMAAPAGDALRVHGSQSGRLSGSLSGGGTTTLRFQPDKNLKPGEQVTVTLSTVVRSEAGAALTRPFVYSFTAKAAPAPVAFGPLQHLNAPGPEEVETADFDGDGDVDIASIGIPPGGFVVQNITLQFNNGAGIFNASKTIQTDFINKTLCVADFNGDGAIDICVTVAGYDYGNDFRVGGPNIFINDGKGNFTGSLQVPIKEPTNDIQAADLNGDGAVDVAFVNQSKEVLTVALNDGSGTFLPPVQYPAIPGAEYLTLADFDGDGDVDIASNAPSVNATGINFNDGMGRFPTTTLVAGGGGFNMATGDLDRDGDVDLVTHGGYNSSSALVYINGYYGATGLHRIGTDVGPQPMYTQLGDLDGDNDLDVVYARYGGFVGVKRNDGTDGTFYEPTPEVLVGDPKLVANPKTLALSIADLDGDQDLDIVAGNVGQNNLSVLLNGGSQPGLSPLALSYDHSGGSKTVAVAYAGAWTAAAGQDWLTVSPAGSTGSGTLTVTAAPNPAAESRTGTVTVTGNGASRTVSITQAGAPATLLVSPGSLTFGPDQQLRQLTITTNAIHTLTVDQPWLLTTAGLAWGSRTVDIQVTENPDARPRSGTITVSGGGLTRTVAVTQEGAAPLLQVQPDYTVFAQPGGEQSLALTSNADWTVSQVPDWLLLSTANDYYRDAALTLTATANPTARSRRATLVFTAGSVSREAVVVQDGLPPAMAISPTSLSFAPDSESKTVTLTANVDWSLSSLPTWVTVSPASGTGDATLTITVAANALSAGRSASIRALSTDGSELITSLFVSQSRSIASPTSLDFAAKGESQTFALTHSGAWSLSTTDTWLQFSPAGGNADATVSVTASANPTPAPRSGKVTITYANGTRTQTVFVSQQAAALTVDPARLDFVLAGGTLTLAVGSNRDWQVSGTESWFELSQRQGTGSTTLTLTAQANPLTTARTAVLTFTAGSISLAVPVSQDGTALPAKLSQSISFAPLPAKNVTDAPFALTATASSGLGVSYASSNPLVATVAGNVLTLVGEGTALITASQEGDATYLPAPEVSQTLTISAPLVNTWNGTDTWSNATHWSQGAAPTLASDGLVASGTVTVSGTAQVGTLTIAAGAVVQVPPGSTLLISGDLINQGGTLGGTGRVRFTKAGTASITGTVAVTATVEVAPGTTLSTGGNLTLEADGILLHGAGTPGGGGSVSGNIISKRTGKTGNAYNGWSSPVSTASTSSLGSTVYAYEESRPYANYQRWLPAPGTLQPAKGYFAQGAGSVAFSGTANEGTFSLPLSYTASHPLSERGFNLVGNPYPGPIDYEAFIDANPSINGALYFWDDDYSGGSGYDNADYAVRTAAGVVAGPNSGALAGQGISAHQGFFVQANVPGSVSFTNAMRRGGTSPSFFRKSAQVIGRVRLSLSGEGCYQEILVAFAPDATPGHDRRYDAPKLESQTRLLLSSRLEGRPYAIQALPPLTVDQALPLGVEAARPGNYSLKAAELEGIDAAFGVLLEDKRTGQVYDLRGQDQIRLQLAAEVYPDRFVLHFKQQAPPVAVPAPEPAAGQEGLQVFAWQHRIYVRFSDGSPKQVSAQLFNLRGQLLEDFPPREATTQRVLESKVGQRQLYLLRLTTPQGVVTKKVLLGW